MKRHLAYLRAIMRHKWFVFLECLKLGVPIMSAILHDWDKFLPDMWNAYSQYFYGDWRGSDPDRNKEAPPHIYQPFEMTWNRHQKWNRHHWQHWVRLGDDGTTLVLPMPDRHRREMLADWRGAGRAYVPNWTPAETVKWYEKNKDKIQLHEDTRYWIEMVLGVRPDMHKPMTDEEFPRWYRVFVETPWR